MSSLNSMKTQKEKPSASEFKIGQQLGQGNFSKVFKAECIATKEVFALKVMEKSMIHRLRARHPNVTNEIQMEKHVLNSLSHPNIIKLYHTFQDPAHLYFLMEYIDGGELWDILREGEKQVGCDIDTARFYAADIVNAMLYMHFNGILHRDLKPENMILSSSSNSERPSHLTLVDFGTAKNLRDTSLNGPNFVGTPEYMPPEAISNKSVGPSADYWALGCIIYQMLLGDTPFNGGSQYLTFLRTQAGEFKIPSFIPDDARDLITSLLSQDPEARLTGSSSICSHPFFRTVDFKNHQKACPPVPSLSYLATRRVVNLLCEDSKSIKSLTKLPLNVQERVKHLLLRREVLHRYELYSKFFTNPIVAHRKYAFNSSYLGGSQLLQGKWEKDFFFVYLTNTIKDGENDNNKSQRLRQAVLKINELKPRFVVLGGNFKSEDGFTEVLAALENIDTNVNLLFVPGDKDVLHQSKKESGIEEYNDAFGDDFYSYWAGGVKCIVINTTLLLSEDSKQDAQNKWLESELDNGKLCGQHMFVFGYHHVMCENVTPCPTQEDAAVVEKKRRALLNLMTEKKVQAYFSVQHSVKNFAENTSDDDNENTLQLISTASKETTDGLRVVRVSRSEMKHEYYSFDNVPTCIK